MTGCLKYICTLQNCTCDYTFEMQVWAVAMAAIILIIVIIYSLKWWLHG